MSDANLPRRGLRSHRPQGWGDAPPTWGWPTRCGPFSCWPRWLRRRRRSARPEGRRCPAPLGGDRAPALIDQTGRGRGGL